MTHHSEPRRQIGFSLVYRIMWGFLALFLMAQAFWAGVTVANGGLAVSTLLLMGFASLGLTLTLVVAGRVENLETRKSRARDD